MMSLKKRAKLTTVNSEARWWRLSSRCGATRGKEKVVVRVRGGADGQMRAQFYAELKSRENSDARKVRSRSSVAVAASIASGVVVTTFFAQSLSSSNAQTTQRYSPEYTASGELN